MTLKDFNSVRLGDNFPICLDARKPYYAPHESDGHEYFIHITKSSCYTPNRVIIYKTILGIKIYNVPADSTYPIDEDKGDVLIYDSKVKCEHTNIDYDLTVAVLDCIPQQIWGKCRDCGEERYFDDKHVELFY